MNTLTSKTEEKAPIVSALVSVGVLMIPAGFLRWYFYHVFVDFGWHDWVFVLSAPVYFALGAAARFGTQRARQWMLVIGFIFHLAYTVSCYERGLNPLSDGSLFQWPSFGLFLWAMMASLKPWEETVGLPPASLKTKMKICACSAGITVSLFTLGIVFLQLKVNTEFFGGGSIGELAYELNRQALFSSAAAAVSASILTLSLITVWSLNRERNSQFKAAKQAAEKKSQV